MSAADVPREAGYASGLWNLSQRVTGAPPIVTVRRGGRRVSLSRASLRDSPSARGIPTGVAPLPRYYGLVRLLLSLSPFAVLPSSLAELSKHAATFAPRGPLRSALPSPPATSPPGFALRRMRPLTPKSSRCGGVGFTHTETLTTRK